jgi:hypothetical protein
MTLIRQEPFYKQLEVETNRTAFAYGKSYVKALHLWVQSVFINIDGNLTAVLNQIKTNLNKC